MTKPVCPHCHATVLSTSQPATAPDDVEVVWLREVNPETDNACWIPSNRVDPTAVAFVPLLQSPAALDASTSGTQGALALYLDAVQPFEGRLQINISFDELSVLRRLVAAAPAVGGEARDIGNYVQHHQDCDVFDKLKRTCTCGLSEAAAKEIIRRGQ